MINKTRIKRNIGKMDDKEANFNEKFNKLAPGDFLEKRLHQNLIFQENVHWMLNGLYGGVKWGPPCYGWTVYWG